MAEDDDRDFWRLGHRRPWWMWNVVTLLVALFVLVWVRELAKLSQTATWLTCVVILSAWAAVPTLLLEGKAEDLPAPRKGSPTEAGDAVTAMLRTMAYSASLMLFVGVFWLGGLAVCILSLVGALLYAAAGRMSDRR
jgi:hypothetical protein